MSTWRVSEALTSVRRLVAVLDKMTEEELVQCISLEEASGRRKSILEKLYRQHRALSRTNQRDAIRQQADNLPL